MTWEGKPGTQHSPGKGAVRTKTPRCLWAMLSVQQAGERVGEVARAVRGDRWRSGPTYCLLRNHRTPELFISCWSKPSTHIVQLHCEQMQVPTSLWRLSECKHQTGERQHLCSKRPGLPTPLLKCIAHFKGSSSCCIRSCSQRALLKGTGHLSQRPHQQTSRLALFWQSTDNGILGFY